MVEFWYPIVQHKIDHVIAPFRQDLSKIEIALAREKMHSRGNSWFKCAVKCNHRNGATHDYTVVNPDVDQALTDSLSRLRRELSRAENNF